METLVLCASYVVIAVASLALSLVVGVVGTFGVVLLLFGDPKDGSGWA